MHKLAAELKQCLWQATDSVTILTGTLLSMEVMEVLCLLPQNGVAVEITIDSQAEVLLQSHRGCLHRCYMLADKGASLYLSPTAVEGLWCFLDYKDMIFVDQEGLLHYHSREDAPSLIQQKLMAYQQIKQHASPYLYEYQDMSIHVSVSEHHVLKGDVVELNWQVTHADKVIVKGLGEVASHGSKRIQVQEDTLIKIGAYNSKQVRLQAFPIWVYKEAILQYDLFFMNSATMQYHSLVNHELFPHVYGVALGSKLRLSWQIPEASTLSVLPFGAMGPFGDMEFTPDKSLEVTLVATVSGAEVRRSIKINVFPIPLYSASMETLHLPKILNIDVMQLVQREQHLQQGIQEIIKIQKERLDHLNSNLNEAKEKLGNTMNLRFLNTLLADLLKRLLSKTRQNTSISTYYEQP